LAFRVRLGLGHTNAATREAGSVDQGAEAAAGLREGDVLAGKYRIEKVLGAGGMGVVVAARHIDLDQRVAIKCLLAHTRTMPEIVERFTREARAAAKIQGEHVARVIDVGRFEDGTPFMVMEYLQGHDLAAQLQEHGPLPVHDAVRYLLETCEAVVQAHAMRIVHRDLKPQNLFLAQQPGRRPIVKVLDFGISKVIEPGASALTKTSSVMGTPYYMSPEQLLSSKNVDERSDIWALGVILYELLIGEPPFVGDTGPEIIAQVLQNNPQPASARRPDLPAGMDQLIGRCMKTKVEERFANVADLAHALMPFAAAGDRESIVAIANVLGVPSLRAGDTMLAAEAPVAARTQGTGASKPPGAQPQTAHNLTLSAGAVEAPKSRAGVWIGVGAAAVAALVGAVVVMRPSAPVTKPVAETPAARAPEPPPPPAVTLAPTESPPPIAPAAAAAASSSENAAPPVAGHGPVPAPGPGHHAAAGTHPAPPSASSAPAVATPAPAPPPAPPPAATATTNFLDMHIR
jgi:serine/threonine-protein kinase